MYLLLNNFAKLFVLWALLIVAKMLREQLYIIVKLSSAVLIVNSTVSRIAISPYDFSNNKQWLVYFYSYCFLCINDVFLRIPYQNNNSGCALVYEYDV